MNICSGAGCVLVIVAGMLSGCGRGTGGERAEESYPPEYARLLAEYVRADGIRYGAWHRHEHDRRALAGVVGFFATTPPPSDRAASLAWHLNAYNAWMLHLILEKYPTAGPLDNDPEFFRKKSLVLSGEPASFDELETERIRNVFHEPRIHFALNCASESCPPLSPMPFTAEKLEMDLEKLTRDFLNRNRWGVAPDGRGGFRVSKLFEWYMADFGGPEGVRDYINAYREEKLPPGSVTGRLDYSWALNRSREEDTSSLPGDGR
jgi:hypothetical protein